MAALIKATNFENSKLWSHFGSCLREQPTAVDSAESPPPSVPVGGSAA